MRVGANHLQFHHEEIVIYVFKVRHVPQSSTYEVNTPSRFQMNSPELAALKLANERAARLAYTGIAGQSNARIFWNARAVCA